MTILNNFEDILKQIIIEYGDTHQIIINETITLHRGHGTVKDVKLDVGTADGIIDSIWFTKTNGRRGYLGTHTFYDSSKKDYNNVLHRILPECNLGDYVRPDEPLDLVDFVVSIEKKEEEECTMSSSLKFLKS